MSADLKEMQFSGRLYTIKGDVTNPEDVSKIVKWTRSSLGGVDVLVNSAGIFDQAPLRSIFYIFIISKFSNKLLALFLNGYNALLHKIFVVARF
jgi:3-oxoacyl-[acyl-carrier protein] reductase